MNKKVSSKIKKNQKSKSRSRSKKMKGGYDYNNIDKDKINKIINDITNDIYKK